jgi:hypothetical protein
VVQEWPGWFLPAGAPRENVQRLTALEREGLEAPEFVEALLKVGCSRCTRAPMKGARRFGSLIRPRLFLEKLIRPEIQCQSETLEIVE